MRFFVLPIFNGVLFLHFISRIYCQKYYVIFHWHHLNNYTPYEVNVSIQETKIIAWRSSSGVASGWHGWTMSRGPRAKGAPRDREKKKRKKSKEKGGAEAPESLLSTGPECTRYATAFITCVNSIWVQTRHAAL